MKLDIRVFRYLSQEDWRVLAAVEAGSRNHEVVPTPLITSLSRLRGGANAAHKSISVLAKANLVAREKNVTYDGYRLTYGGLDYLALHAHSRAGAVAALGSQMGVGKESDIYLVTTPAPSSSSGAGGQKAVQAILKLHRLGRTSFRSLRTNRAYHRGSSHASWHRLSELSAQREYAAMRALAAAGFRVPQPIACSRHAVVMSLVPGTPLRAVQLRAFGGGADVQEKAERDRRVGALYAECMELALQLAGAGVIHGDFNEFNILVENAEPHAAGEDEGDGALPDSIPAAETKPMIPHLIDLPQVTSMSHPQAKGYFDRDVQCIKSFFRKRFHFESEDAGPTFEDASKRLRTESERGGKRLDVEIEAAGFSRKLVKELESYYSHQPEEGDEQEAEDEEAEWEHGADNAASGDLSNLLETHLHLGNEELDLRESSDTGVDLPRPIYTEVENHPSILGDHVPRAKSKAAVGWSI